jgi:hypothetical protein
MTMLVSSFNISQSFNYTPYLFYKKLFKSEINSFCIWTLRKYIFPQQNFNMACSAQEALDILVFKFNFFSSCKNRAKSTAFDFIYILFYAAK